MIDLKLNNYSSISIFFIYHICISLDTSPGCRKGYYVYCFEKEITKIIKQKNYSSEVEINNNVEIRIPIKHCIKSTTSFWNKNGFSGNSDSVHLSKFVYF